MKNVDKLQAILRQKAGYTGSTEDLNNYLSTKGNADKVVSILNKTAGYTGSVDDFKNYIGISDTVETEEQHQQETKISAVGVPDLVSPTDTVKKDSLVTPVPKEVSANEYKLPESSTQIIKTTSGETIDIAKQEPWKRVSADTPIMTKEQP